MKAWQTYSNKSTDTDVAAAPAGATQAEIPKLDPSHATLNAQPGADGLLLVLRSMISAAHADGHLSEQEQKKI